MKKLGLIVNPVAGMGGSVGLKGTDGPELVERARELGAIPRAEQRTEAALDSLLQIGGDFEPLTYGGAMGESAIVSRGMTPSIVGRAASLVSTSKDTKDAARELAARGVDLLLFTGGDGTARDIYDAVGTSITTLGVPAGVKIQSAVFATNPIVAGQVASVYLADALQRTKHAEVMDIDEKKYRQGILSAQLYGYLQIPDARHRVQNRKAASTQDERTLQQAIAAEVIQQLVSDRLYIVGPGTTCGAVMVALGLENSLLGADLICGQELIGRDLNERSLLDAIGGAECSLLLTPVGGQGFLLGRGNQQISPEVLWKVGKENISVLATTGKIASLRGRPLLVDTGNAECDSYLCGYYRVITGYRETTVYRVSEGS